MPAPPRWDVIVVGAGHNGLTAGALLAQAGLATLVVEARDVAGGCCVTEEIAPGWAVASQLADYWSYKDPQPTACLGIDSFQCS